MNIAKISFHLFVYAVIQYAWKSLPFCAFLFSTIFHHNSSDQPTRYHRCFPLHAVFVHSVEVDQCCDVDDNVEPKVNGLILLYTNPLKETMPDSQ